MRNSIMNGGGGHRAVAGLALAVGAGLLFLAIRPSPDATLGGHWRHFALSALPSLVLFGVAVRTARTGLRWGALAFALAAMGIASLIHPVCVPITSSELPAFESVRSLEERAAAGEPFCRLDGSWYQCKSYISRVWFF